MKTGYFKIIVVLFYTLLCNGFSAAAQYYPGGLSNSNLKIWLDANDATTFTLSSGTVSQWNDKSGSGTNVIGAAGSRPSYLTNQINTYPAVQTNGSSTYLSGTFTVNGITQMSMLSAATPATNNASGGNPYSVNYPIFYWGMETGSWGQVGMELNTMNTGFYGYGWRFGTSQASADVFYNPSPVPSGVKVLAAVHNGTASEIGYYNGFNITAPTAGALSGKLSTIANTPNTFGVGRGQTAYGGNSYGGNNLIGEILIYNTSLNITQLVLLQNYLAAKWGTTLTTIGKYTPPTATTYNYNMVGVGREAADSVAYTRSTKGFGLRVGSTSSDFLKDNGDYICAAYTNPLAVNLATTFLPSGTVQRWADEWYLIKTDVGGNGGNLNIFFNYTTYGIGGTSGTSANYQLLYRSSTGSTVYSVIGTATPTASGNIVSFLVPASSIANGYYTLGTANTAASPLPIELLSFSADRCEKEVCLNWRTATETNNDHFEIERSSDGINFEFVTSVNAFGDGNSNTMHEYKTTDPEPFNGNSYYRLKQIDKDGKFTYSDLAAVNFEDHSFISLYPNPVTDKLKINLSDDYLNASASIIDSYGNTVSRFKINSSEMQMDLSSFAAGIYYVIIQNGTEITKTKLIFQK